MAARQRPEPGATIPSCPAARRSGGHHRGVTSLPQGPAQWRRRDRSRAWRGPGERGERGGTWEGGGTAARGGGTAVPSPRWRGPLRGGGREKRRRRRMRGGGGRGWRRPGPPPSPQGCGAEVGCVIPLHRGWVIHGILPGEGVSWLASEANGGGAGGRSELPVAATPRHLRSLQGVVTAPLNSPKLWCDRLCTLLLKTSEFKLLSSR